MSDADTQDSTDVKDTNRTEGAAPDNDRDGGSDGTGSEVVEVAPDPERTGIDIDKPERADALSAEELERIREERLDPDNRPDNVEVDNTQRDFDTTTGKFTDSDLEEDVGPFDEDAV
jgi:hypothetical protein